VSFPIKNGGSFHSYVSLPEGTFYVTFIEYYIIISHMHPCAPCMVYLPTLLGDFLQAMLVNIPAPWVAYFGNDVKKYVKGSGFDLVL
jgi:hypothetical protein